ncbi:MAG: hypothetical protein ACK4S0_11080, partial [Sediminibacterium sp.]
RKTAFKLPLVMAIMALNWLYFTDIGFLLEKQIYPILKEEKREFFDLGQMSYICVTNVTYGESEKKSCCGHTKS